MGASAQQQCALGTYAETTGSSVCANADLGYYVDTVGASAQQECEAGTYAGTTGSSTCLACLSSADEGWQYSEAGDFECTDTTAYGISTNDYKDRIESCRNYQDYCECAEGWADKGTGLTYGVEIKCDDEQKIEQSVALAYSFFGFFLLFVLPLILAKTVLKDMLEGYGITRFGALMTFGLVMLSLPLKMYFRWIFNLKYFIAIPEYFFNI